MNLTEKEIQIIYETIEEHHPHITQKLKIVWGTEKFGEYINELIFTDRTDRTGFDDVIIKCLYKLSGIHDVQYPEFKAKDFRMFNNKREDV